MEAAFDAGKMQQQQQPPKKHARVDTLEIKARLIKLMGNQRAEVYFRSFKRFMECQLSQEDFSRICKDLLGKEALKLHNVLIKSIYSNALTASEPPPSKQAATGNSQTSLVSNGTLNGAMIAARRVRPVTNRERRFGDKPSPLGKSPLGPGAGEFVSTGSKAMQEVISVEDGEEVNQARGSPVCVQSQSPIRAPLGVAALQNSQPPTSCSVDVCYNNGELPDSELLSKLLEDKLKDQGLSVPKECADVLNSGLNAYMSQMLKACLAVAKARTDKRPVSAPALTGGQFHGFPAQAGRPYQASLLDLWAAVQSNARIVGCAQQREKIASHLVN